MAKSDQQKIKDSKNPDVKLIADDLKRVSDISALADMPGGKLLIKSLLSDIIGKVDTLCAKYSTLTTQEFIALCADMNTKLEFVNTLKKSKKNKKQALLDLQEVLAAESD